MNKNIQTWITDENGNKCSVEYFGGKEAAKIALDSLKNCRNCTNCSGCKNCEDCSHCSGCSGCLRCSGCKNCEDCIDIKYAENNVSIIESELNTNKTSQ